MGTLSEEKKSKLYYCFGFFWRPFLGYSSEIETKRELNDPAKLKRQIRAHDYQGNQNLWSARRGRQRWGRECYIERKNKNKNTKHSRSLYTDPLESLTKYYCISRQGKSP